MTDKLVVYFTIFFFLTAMLLYLLPMYVCMYVMHRQSSVYVYNIRLQKLLTLSNVLRMCSVCTMYVWMCGCVIYTLYSLYTFNIYTLNIYIFSLVFLNYIQYIGCILCCYVLYWMSKEEISKSFILAAHIIHAQFSFSFLLCFVQLNLFGDFYIL